MTKPARVIIGETSEKAARILMLLSLEKNLKKINITLNRFKKIFYHVRFEYLKQNFIHSLTLLILCILSKSCILLYLKEFISFFDGKRLKSSLRIFERDSTTLEAT